MIHDNIELLKHSRELMIEIHRLTLLLSSMPIFGEAKNFTRSISSATSSITESHQKKHYNYEFIKYLVNNHDADQNNHDLETLFQKGKLNHENFYVALKDKFERLCSTINGLKQSEENDTIKL